MRFCYANRRFTLYPDSLNSWDLAPANYNDAFLKRVKSIGFDALEVGMEVLEKTGGTERQIKEFGKRVAGAGLPIGCVRSGGTLTDAKHGPRNQERMARAVDVAAWLGAEVVNGALSAPARQPGHPAGSKPGSNSGWPISQDSSRDAMFAEHEALARALQAVCDRAARAGTNISVEVHQNSLVDNSWSAKQVHKLVARKNFGINPDLGNVYWNYDVPEEDTDASIKAMASISVYWHCKNLMRVYHPENQRSVYLRVPLPDGEIDYRFAISAMAAANYKGFMAIEGAWAGDQFYADEKSLTYSKGIWAEFEKAAPRSR